MPNEFPILETRRLILRPLRDTDLDPFHKLLVHPAVRKYLLDDEVMPVDWVESEIKQSTATFALRGFGLWGCFPKGAPAALIGFCGYRHFHEPPELQLLYGLAPSWWGRGLATESGRAAVRYGFQELGFEKIIACADTPNIASIRVMQRIGLTFEKETEIHGIDTTYYTLPRTAYRPAHDPYHLQLVPVLS
jgi:ribosomal-protein-alanine N-acetyltransferase